MLYTIHKLSSTKNNMHVVEHALDNIAKTLYINPELFGDMYTAVTEAVYNAIQHGNKFDTNKHVEFKYTIQNNTIEFVISDEGKGFNYKNLTDPTLPENIEKESGRGVFFINKLAHHVSFNSLGNSICLKFNLTKEIA